MTVQTLRRAILGAALVGATFAGTIGLAWAHGSEVPEGAEVFFVEPHDGETVSSPVLVKFGLSGMEVAPAGTEMAHTGHHHLIVDAPLPPKSEAIPSDANHLHFGGGQTETMLELTPGPHTLQLMLGDGSHMPHSQPVVSKQITIIVE